MDIKQLAYFIAIVEEGNISAAAKKLHLSQPPLSHQLKLLEQELNLQLLERGPRSVRLTEAGKVLYKRAQNILELAELARKELNDLGSGLSGTLHLGTVSSSGAALLGWRMGEFHRQYPQVTFEIHEGNTFELLELLSSGIIEVAIVRTPFNNETVECLYLDEEPMIAAGIRTFFQQDSSTITLRSLSQMPIIIYRRFERVLLTAFDNAGQEPQIFCISDDARTALMWAEAGLGVAIVPLTAYQIMPHRNIIYQKIDNAHLYTKIAAIWRKDGYLSSPAKSFLDLFRH